MKIFGNDATSPTVNREENNGNIFMRRLWQACLHAPYSVSALRSPVNLEIRKFGSYRKIDFWFSVETPITPRPPPSLPRRNESRERTESLAEEDTDDSSSEDVVLFVCGMQSITLLLIIEKSAATSEESVQSLVRIFYST